MVGPFGESSLQLDLGPAAPMRAKDAEVRVASPSLMEDSLELRIRWFASRSWTDKLTLEGGHRNDCRLPYSTSSL